MFGRKLLFPIALCALALAACGRSNPALPEAEIYLPRDDAGRPSPTPEPDAQVPEGSCGNGQVEPGEHCDGNNLAGSTCEVLGFLGGELRCGEGCRFDTAGCARDSVPSECARLPSVGLPDACLSGLCRCDPEAFVACDDACFGLIECALDLCPGPGPSDRQCVVDNCPQWLEGGPAALALEPCLLRVADQCVERTGSCGNGQIEPGEQCDGAALGGASCRDQGWGSGTLGCNRNCRYDLSACRNDARCGDGVVDPGEQCDGADLAGQRCRDYGLSQGELACDASCRVDLRGCHTCGDGVIQAGERCDRENLDGLSCGRLGFSGGSLRCSADCAYDTSGCAVCGNGVIEVGENCDGDQFGGRSCESLGLGSGSLACHPTACLLDISGCAQAGAQVCGNGVAEAGEQCDGRDLTGQGCVSLGYDLGDLVCNRTTCRFDTSGCRFDTARDPGSTCSECSAQACADISAACQSNPDCLGGLECLSQRCGASGELACAMECFPDLNAAITAVSMFGCVTTSCGSDCVGL